jgi:hypothetical protein
MAAGGIGAQLSQPPISLINTANGVTQKYFQPQLVDAVFKPSPFWWRLTRLGRKFHGGSLVWNLINQEELTGGAFWGTQLLPTDVTDSAQPAELQWRAYQQLCAIPIIDAVLNQGPHSVVNLVRVKEEISFGSLLMKLNRAAQRTAPQNTSIDIDGVPLALVGSGSYAGVTIQNNASTGFVWMCNGGAGPQTMTALNTLAGSPAVANMSLAGLQYVYGECSFGNEEPTLGLTTQAGWNAYWGLLVNNQRFIEDEETTRGGFRNLMFNRAVIMRDPFVPAGQFQFYSEKYVRPIFHPNMHFRMDPYIQPSNQYVAITRVYVMLNIQFLSLRHHGMITGIASA